MRERVTNLSDPHDWFRAWKLSAAAIALLETISPDDCHDRARLIERVKNFTLPLRGPRPIAEAISSAGGVRWSELDEKSDGAEAARNFCGGRDDRLGSADRRLSPSGMFRDGNSCRPRRGTDCSPTSLGGVADLGALKSAAPSCGIRSADEACRRSAILDSQFWKDSLETLPDCPRL